MIEEGTSAPDVTLHTDDGGEVKLSDLRGEPTVLYFYSKDMTPGCTAQASGIRDAWAEFTARGAHVFGVSMDDAEAHRAFREELSLPFPLLVDEDRSLADAFDIGRGSYQGHEHYKRQTILIDADGVVARVFDDVDPSTHAREVLAALDAQPAPAAAGRAS